jgi:TolB-like protein
VRRTPALVFVIFSSIALLAAKPAAKPSPTPTPSVAPSASARPVPMLVVFPFQTSTDLKPDTGQRAAQLFVQQMNGAGGLDAISAPASEPRSDYLNYARKLQADYYLMGYMTPLGAGVSLVEQLVSTQSGTIVFGNTAEIDSFDDASSQAVQVHGAVLAMEASDAERYNSSQAESTSTPAPPNQANLGKGISDFAGLFKRHTATPKPNATQKPSKGVIVVRAGGSVPSSDLVHATSVLFEGLNSHFNTKMSAASPVDMSKQADGICGTSRDNTIATGALAAKVFKHGLGSKTQWTFTLDVYTCFGAKLAETPGTGDSLDSAVQAAVDAYTTAHPLNS